MKLPKVRVGTNLMSLQDTTKPEQNSKKSHGDFGLQLCQLPQRRCWKMHRWPLQYLGLPRILLAFLIIYLPYGTVVTQNLARLCCLDRHQSRGVNGSMSVTNLHDAWTGKGHFQYHSCCMPWSTLYMQSTVTTAGCQLHSDSDFSPI